MKTTTHNVIWSFLGLCCVLLVYACRNQDAEPLTPYVFNTLRDLAMPAAKISAPPSVTVTPASISASSRANAVNSGIAAIPGSSQIPAEVSQAVTDINSALSAANLTATVFSSGFTPDVVTTLTAQGTLPASVQTSVNTLTANPVIIPYLLTYSFPQVNGQTITPTSTSVVGPGLVSPIVVPVVVQPIRYSGADQCYKAANDLFDSKIKGLDSTRLAQIASVNSTYATEKTNAESEIASCLSTGQSKYSNLITTARQDLTANIANLNGARLKLGEAAYQSLTALIYVQYSYQIQSYYKLKAAEFNVCPIVSALRIESAQFARDTDRNSINDAFNTTIKMAQELVLKLYDSCHNQGSGQ